MDLLFSKISSEDVVVSSLMSKLLLNVHIFCVHMLFVRV